MEHPKPTLGIRAIIDGRRQGVREALEDRTQQLATLAAQLITENVFYRDGTKCKVILSKGTIGGVAEARRNHDYFMQNNVCATLDITYAWAYAAEILEMETEWPKAIWGFNGSQRPGAVYLAGAIAAAEQKKLPVFKIYGEHVQDIDDIAIPEDVADKILQFTRSAISIGQIKDYAYLSVGGVSMGIGGSIVEPRLFQNYFKMRNEFVDMSEITRRLQKNIYDVDEFQSALQWVQNNCVEMNDPNPLDRQKTKQEKDGDWETVVKMTLIIRDLMIGNPKLAGIGYEEEAEGHDAIVAGFQGQRQWTDFMPNGDFSEAILNSSFDWNGIRIPYIIATENDSLNGITMLLGNLLTGTAQIFADVRTYWSPQAISRVIGKDAPENLQNGFIYLTNSGAGALDGSGEAKISDGTYGIKPFWQMTEADVQNCISATKWGPGKLASFRGGGFSSSFTTRGGLPITVARVNIVEGLGLSLQIAEGYTVELNEETENIITKRTDPTWPKTFFVPRLLPNRMPFDSVYSVMEAWGSNHCAFSYGHIGKDWLTLASMLRIPVSMHNVDYNAIFRPAAWKHFGPLSSEASDILACKNYGPLFQS